LLPRRGFLLGAALSATGQTQPAQTQPAQTPATPSRRTAGFEIPAGDLVKAEAAPPELARLRWRLQYEFNGPVEANKDVPIQVEVSGLHFASARYGAAWLTTFEQQRLGDPNIRFGKGYVLVTRDGGKTWTPQRTKGYPRHFFALDESRCWLLSSDGIYYSPEFGAGWEKRKTPFDKLTRLHFLDDRVGFAFGFSKLLWRTNDGGKSWAKVPESEALSIKSPNTLLAAMSFVSPKSGLVAGSSQPERMERASFLDALPPWMAPDRAVRKRELPGTLFVMETNDAGQTWKSSLTSGFGVLTELKLAPRGGVAVLSFGESIEWPTEVIRLDPRKGTNEPLFRRKKYEVTDCAVLANGGYVLAAIEHSGRLRTAGVAGRLKIFWSNDGVQWIDMKVHYSAEGTSAFLSRVSDTEVWAATNQGQILKLSQ
jgi:hypothetical protein